MGGKGSTIAARLEKILEKKEDYLSYAKAQEELKEKIIQKETALKKLAEGPKIKSLASDLQKGKATVANIDSELQLLNQKAQVIEKEIKELDKKLANTEKIRVSFTKEVASTDNVRDYLDTHRECNFTEREKVQQLKNNESHKKFGFFQTPACPSPTIQPSRTPKSGRGGE